MTLKVEDLKVGDIVHADFGHTKRRVTQILPEGKVVLDSLRCDRRDIIEFKAVERFWSLGEGLGRHRHD